MASKISLDKERYIALLTKLIGVAEQVQNNPPKFVPREMVVVEHVQAQLAPYTGEGGPLTIALHEYVEGRPNVIIEYHSKPVAEENGTIAIVGSHLDCVPADPETWTKDPFTLSREGDKLYGRGTTDCLGHVALVTELFVALAEQKPQLEIGVVAVFIASEENSTIPGVGVEQLVKAGLLDHIKDGPLLWCDSADSQPCIGTAAAIQWTLKFTGKLFHSGLPHKGINALEMAMECVPKVQERFYEEFPPHEQEEKYGFTAPSTMKPTQIKISEGSVNQLPAWVEVTGDIRATPFYDPKAIQAAIEGYVAELNADLPKMESAARGPMSKYALSPENNNSEKGLNGKIELTWEGEVFRGIACKLDSVGYHALVDSTKEVLGEAKPYSITGSLPLVGDMQDAGYDVQICGYGKSAVYHGNDEYCCLSDMENAMKILGLCIDKVSDAAKK